MARHSIDAFRSISRSPSVCLVGYQHQLVAEHLGDDNLHVLSRDSTGGTALAAYEAFAVEQLQTHDPVVVVSMGDRIVPAAVFQRLLAEHHRGEEATLTMLTAIYPRPGNHGKGRIVRDADGNIIRIVEQRDIDRLPHGEHRQSLQDQIEGNCPLYAIRARTLKHYLGQVDRSNAQQQFYFTDIIEAIHHDGGAVRSVTTQSEDPAHALLCADVTNRDDLNRLTRIYRQYTSAAATGSNGEPHSIDEAAERIARQRPAGQIDSIANQLCEFVRSNENGCNFVSDRPIGVGISGGRLRIAFMHPDMERFFGPAWQMPIGAPEGSSGEQIVVLMQATDDGTIQLRPTDPEFTEAIDSIDAQEDFLFPDAAAGDIHRYESFGTKMAQQILARLGYVTDEQLEQLRVAGEPLPPPARWVSNNMRRPFSLLANAIASIRTLSQGTTGRRVQASLSRENFGGLKVVSTGNIPRGGFSSSSAVTVATQNAVSALYSLGIDEDKLVDLACQAEYGTGVRAGALDQATEQKGTANQGALISSNPAENYRIIRTFRVPAERFRVLFPYTVDRDREAWRWSHQLYAESSNQDRLTTSETRKMTGKAAEIAAILLRMPLEQDFFPEIEDDLVERGELTTSTSMHVADRLKSIPLLIRQEELKRELKSREPWYIDQLVAHRGLDRDEAVKLADVTLQSLLSGWRDPLLTRECAGTTIDEIGAPLRAMVGYLYGEVAKNCYLVHHPEEWIKCVTASQRGDRCLDIDPESLPRKQTMMSQAAWEKSATGSELMDRWLRRYDATPFDFNAGLDDVSLCSESFDPRKISGTNFFRGLPLIDLIEAMLKRAFGDDAVAVRVNGAGQGDYFQIHVDTKLADPEEVKQFVRAAFYRRFSLTPPSEFVEPHPGGGAVGVKLERNDELPELISKLRQHADLARAEQPRREDETAHAGS